MPKYLLHVLVLLLILGGGRPARIVSAAGVQQLLIKQQYAIDVEVVISRAEQQLGLGHRKSLSHNKGMLFVYHTAGERVFWMKGMRFSIDIIWLKNGKIVHIAKKVPPPSVMAPKGTLKTYGHGVEADSVLEVVAGFADAHQLKNGDRVDVIEARLE